MFDKNSRYYNIEEATISTTGKDEDTRIIAYKKRRFIPESESMTMLLEHTVTEGERLDNITALYLGDPTRFWRICDANLILDPEELTKDIGRRIKVAMPGI
jgi:hypothetical protein